MPTKLKTLLVGVVAASALCLAPAMAQDNVRAAIEAANKRFAAGVVKGDAAQLATMYTNDAEAFPPNGDIVRGRGAIQKLWQDFLNSGVKGVALTTLEVEAHGATAHETGTYVIKGDADKVLDQGKYVVIWKRAQGQWRLHRDIWNTSMPATGR